MLITEKTAIASDELLARFILHRRLLRPDKTIKPEAFIPHPYQDLSVTRHLRLTEKALWETGQNVARQTGKTLYGRADILADVLLDLLEKGVLRIAFHLDEHPSEISSLLKKYHDCPMSLADACLVRMAELFDRYHVFTLDSDFAIYRKHG